MAITATLATPLSTIPAGYVVNCEITISNSAANSVTIKDIEPAIKSHPITFAEDRSSWAASPVSLVGNPIPAGGSQQFLLRVVFHGSNRLGSYDVSNPNGTFYDLGCIIYSADGEVVVPTPLSVTVTSNEKEI